MRIAQTAVHWTALCAGQWHAQMHNVIVSAARHCLAADARDESLRVRSQTVSGCGHRGRQLLCASAARQCLAADTIVSLENGLRLRAYAAADASEG